MAKSTPSTPPIQKVHGKPLQELYAGLLQLEGPSAPREIVPELLHSLQEEGLDYHLRTLKRQLQGGIEYVPTLLEFHLTQWVEQKKTPDHQMLLNNLTFTNFSFHVAT